MAKKTDQSIPGDRSIPVGEKEWDFPTRKFACPPDIFGPDTYVVRKRFMKVKAVRKIQAAITETEVFKVMADYIVEWNLDDVETGEPLAQPYQNPEVLDEVDILEQFPWILETLFLNPPSFPKGR